MFIRADPEIAAEWKGGERLRTGGTRHLLMKESVSVRRGLDERAVMKTVLKATIWPGVRQIPASPLYKVIFGAEMQQSATSFTSREPAGNLQHPPGVVHLYLGAVKVERDRVLAHFPTRNQGQ